MCCCCYTDSASPTALSESEIRSISARVLNWCSSPLSLALALSISGRSRGTMEAKMSKFFGSVSDFFTGADHIPWCDRDVIAGCEREVAEAEKGSSDELISECIMRLSWALVHSRQPEDVQRGIAMLEASISGTKSPLQLREQLYLLAVGYYRSGDYTKSRDLVERCLRIAPDWRQALSLKKTIEDRITKDGIIGIGIAATAVGLLAGGLAAALSRKK